jgi:hypothetical protein
MTGDRILNAALVPPCALPVNELETVPVTGKLSGVAKFALLRELPVPTPAPPDVRPT